MTGQELATAVQHDLDPVILVVNNNMYGTIRMHQEKMYPGRAMATDLVNPDFAALARSFGAHAEVVERTAEFEPAFDRALGRARWRFSSCASIPMPSARGRPFPRFVAVLEVTIFLGCVPTDRGVPCI